MDVSHLDMARELMRTCYELYHMMPTGLSPELAVFNVRTDGKRDFDTQVGRSSCCLVFTVVVQQ